MNWTDYFDEIFLINLPDRPDRLKAASAEFEKYNIPFTVWGATPHENGMYGLNLTMKHLFESNSDKNRILVFEDDVKFVEDPNLYMGKCIEQLKETGSWKLFYLGINMDNEQNTFNKFTAPNLLPVTFGYGTHAVAYNRSAITDLIYQLNNCYIFETPYDKIIANSLQKQPDKCFCSYPLLVTQRDGYSDIQKSESTYEYIQQRFDHSVKHLLK